MIRNRLNPSEFEEFFGQTTDRSNLSDRIRILNAKETPVFESRWFSVTITTAVDVPGIGVVALTNTGGRGTPAGGGGQTSTVGVVVLLVNGSVVAQYSAEPHGRVKIERLALII